MNIVMFISKQHGAQVINKGLVLFKKNVNVSGSQCQLGELLKIYYLETNWKLGNYKKIFYEAMKSVLGKLSCKPPKGISALQFIKEVKEIW